MIELVVLTMMGLFCYLCYLVGRATAADDCLQKMQATAHRDVERQRILRRIKAGGDQ